MQNTTPLIPHILFYFVRHGETEWNRIHQTLCNEDDVLLNQAGMNQATHVSKHLHALGITRIVSSPLLRAKQTAEIINSQLKVPLDFNIVLREGDWNGKDHESFVGWVNGSTPPDMKEYELFQEKITKEFSTILIPPHTTLLVSHGLVYRWLLRILNINTDHVKAENCVVYLFSPPLAHTSDQWTVHEANSDEKNESSFLV